MYGYRSNTPTYGYQKPQKTPTSPYYRAATMGAGGETKNQAPFTSLASPGRAPVAGYGGQPPDQRTGLTDAAGHPVAQSAIDASKAQNPQAAGANGSYFAGGQGGPDPVAQMQAVQYDYRTDPALQGILATGAATRQDAEINALAGKKHIALQYGDAALGNLIGDTATAQAAAANPYGVFGRLKSQYDQNAHGLDENYNQQNLFYSGARELGQGGLAQDYGSQVADATGQEQQALGSIEANRLAQILGANQADNQGKSDAVSRALEIGRANGWTFRGFGPDGSPQFDKPNDVTPPATTPTDPSPPVDTTPAAKVGQQGGGNASLTAPDPLAAVLGNAAVLNALKRAKQGYDGPVGGSLAAWLGGI